jgi:hypothetical protein
MALTCQVPLRTFLGKIQKYNIIRDQTSKGFTATIKRSGRSVDWAIMMQDDVNNLRELIAAKLVTINILLNLHAM